MKQIMADDGNGSRVIKNWYWILRAWIVPVGVFIFTLGVTWATLNNKVNQNYTDIKSLERKIECLDEIKQELAIIRERIEGIKETVNSIERRMNKNNYGN